ncbi:MAG: pyridoxal phosphate-dependent aminotransferase [Sphingomonadaceae bacterium]
MNPAQVSPFHAITISRLAHQLQSEGRSIIHMEFGQPSTGAPPRAIAVAKTMLDAEPGAYWESPPLRERIAQLYADRHGLTIDPARIILTCGASPALVLAITALFSPGDHIAFVRPGYVAYRNTVAALGRVPVEIEADASTRFQMAASHIESLTVPPAGLIVASPANPTGTMIDRAELAAIAAVARARGIRIISDEIYHGLSYAEPSHSMLEFDPNAIIINSFSKYFSMVGWRLGWIVAPPGTADTLRAYLGNMFLTAPTLSQHVALCTMDETEILEQYRDTYRSNRAQLLDALPQLGLSEIAPPDGAFYIWANISAFTDDSLDFCRRLLTDTGVTIAPGIDFDPVNGHRFARFSLAVSEAETSEAITRFAAWLKGQPRIK